MILLHAYTTAWAAAKLGDPTPRQQNYFSFNFFTRLDTFGTILLPAISLACTQGIIAAGFTKPIRINAYYFKHPKKAIALIALAGIGVHALTAGCLLSIARVLPIVFKDFFFQTGLIALSMGIYSLIPFPPFSGARLLALILPYRFTRKMHQLTPVGITFAILFFLCGGAGKSAALLEAAMRPLIAL